MKDKIVKWLEENGIYSPRLRSQIADNALRIAGSRKIDIGLFDSWLKNLSLEGVMNIGSYFLKCFETELRSGRLEDNPIPASSASSLEAASTTPQSVAEFEERWEEWKKLLKEFDEENNIPARGVICSDDNNYVRAVSDGKGGLIYIDGTVSEKYPRLEDLEPAEQQELIATVKALHGSLIYLDKVVRSMQEHASTS